MRAEGMDPDPEDVIVTTGGQQAIDLVAKTLVDPGDVVICEAPDLSRRGARSSARTRPRRCRSAMDDEGMRIDELEEVCARLEREGRRPKFIYTVPTFQNPAGVTMSAERRVRLVELARERELLVVEDNPYGLLRYEGEPNEPLYKLDGGDYVALPGHVLEDPLAGHPARLAVRPAAGDGEGGARQAGRGPLHLDPHPVLRPRVLRRGQLALVRRRPLRRSTASAATRCSRRSPTTSPRGRAGRGPGGGLFCWATLPSYIDTTDLLAKALRENVAFVPGAAAYVDGRGGSSMRLNFSASAPDEIREGIRRIGGVIDEQVELYETITGEHPPRSSAAPASGGGRVGRGLGGAVSPRRDSNEGRRAEGRSWARAPGVAAQRGTGRGRAAGARTRGGAGRRRRGPRGHAQGRAPRGRVRRPARRRRRGRHRPGAARDPPHPLHRSRRPRLRALDRQGRRQARAARRRGADPRLGGVQRAWPSASWARPTPSRRSRPTSASRS